MNILFILIPISLILFTVIIGLLFWAIKNRQYDDLDSPQYRILFDDRQQNPVQNKSRDKSSL